jgi:hypothetical protein
MSSVVIQPDALVTDLQSGRRRLPLHQTPTGPDVAA